MACKEQIESHVHEVMEVRDKLREAEAPGLGKLQRLTLLSDATGIIHKVIERLGYIESLTSLRDECHTRFMEACQ